MTSVISWCADIQWGVGFVLNTMKLSAVFLYTFKTLKIKCDKFVEYKNLRARAGTHTHTHMQELGKALSFR
jgi:hypothetical protein